MKGEEEELEVIDLLERDMLQWLACSIQCWSCYARTPNEQCRIGASRTLPMLTNRAKWEPTQWPLLWTIRPAETHY